MSINGIGQSYYQNNVAATNRYNKSNAEQFLEGTNNGIPDYSFTVGDSMYIDKEKAKWAQYMNPLGAKFYTAEEMAQMQAELIAKNTATKLSDSYSIIYKKLHPEYNGERIFCEYPGGPLYTADEIRIHSLNSIYCNSYSPPIFEF